MAQKLHRWLALIVGLQLLVWATSGLYMVAVHIDIIHGDHLIADDGGVLSASQLGELHHQLNAIIQSQSGVTRVSYPATPHDQTLLVVAQGATFLLDSQDLERVSPPNEHDIKRLAVGYYAGDAPIASARYLDQVAPGEIGGRQLPLWQVNFADVWGTSLYLSPSTGELVTRRHTLWRVFDFLWMLHIMDYETRENVNNWPLRIVSSLGFTLVVSGLLLLVLRLRLGAWR